MGGAGAGWRAALVAGALCAACVLLAAPSGAATWERLVMPGPLSAAHAEHEADCGRCHSPFDRKSEDVLCTTCHEDVAADVAKGQGFHGRSPAVRAAECRSCHVDHRGRDFDITGLDRDAFDHGTTDFALEGAHAATACEGCHEPQHEFREAPSACIDCHAEDDPHAGELGRDCGSCHVAAAWTRVEPGAFDHDETDFPLVGVHRDTRCGLCHTAARYDGTPTQCIDCHRLDDAHEGRFGTDCASCHQSEGWKHGDFDHAAASDGFALRGAHAKARCESCHVEPPGKQELARDCHSCHRLDDTHRGANGRECGSCHDTSAWTHGRFDHEKETGFALRGSHARLDCRSCHPRSIHEPKPDPSCIGCHEQDDAHGGQLGTDCERCHSEAGFAKNVFFDHDLTAFPLLGLHATVACEECHVNERFHDVSRACSDCHRQDDRHEQRLGPRCERCHNPNGWAVWRFDHDTRTAFALHGAHEGIACESCHQRPMTGEVRASKECGVCHARDDAHRGRFGRDCGLCHGEKAWKPARIGSLR